MVAALWNALNYFTETMISVIKVYLWVIQQFTPLKKKLPRNVTKWSKIQKNPKVMLNVLLLHARSAFYRYKDKVISCPQSMFWALAAISGICFIHGRHHALITYHSAHRLLLALRDLMQFCFLLYYCYNVFFFSVLN